MDALNEGWTPAFGNVFTWFAMDKNGKIAVMVNNCFGNIPLCILKINKIDEWLEKINEYMWEESSEYTEYPEDKGGDFEVDLYSCQRFKHKNNREEVEQELREDFIDFGRESEINFIANRGFFEYFALEGGYNDSGDFPIGYDGETKNGDYYRYLVPSIYASINDFPSELHHIIAVSNTLDFTKDRLLDNNKINEYFPNCYL